VDRLDVRRAQVIIEAMLVEVSNDASRDLGVNWIVDGSGDNFLVGLFNTPIAGVSIADIARGINDPSSVTSAPGGFTVGGGRNQSSGTNFAAILRALASNGDTNVVSMPSVITLDNEEAQIKVAQEVPFLTGQFTNTGTAGGAGQPVPDHRAQGSRQHPEDHPADHGRRHHPAQDRAGSFRHRSARSPGFHDRPRDQQAHHLNPRAGGRRRHARARRPDRGSPDRKREPRAGARQDPVHRRALSRAQHPEDEDEPHGLHTPARAATPEQAAFETNAKYNYLRDMQLNRNDGKVKMMPGAVQPTLPPLVGPTQTTPLPPNGTRTPLSEGPPQPAPPPRSSRALRPTAVTIQVR
jgi:general secretion pathway protein D